MHLRLLLPLCAAAFVITSASAETPYAVQEGRAVDVILGDGWGEAKGVFRKRSHVIFSPTTQEPERRLYEVFDPHPALDLDFSWTADDLTADRPGRISGNGRLVWRKKDAPVYDDSGIVSAYRGMMLGGRPEGQGLYATRDGLVYEGQWRNGRPHGKGRLILPGGEEYVGDFRNGRADGTGIFTETTWERFEGSFRDGLRQGAGKTTLPSGLAYESDWRQGRETPNSYRIRVAQAGAAPPIGGTEDVKFGITMDRAPRLPQEVKPRDVMLYAARSTAEGLVIEPSDKRMVAAWIGKGELQNHLYWGTEPRDGLFHIENGYVQPAAFKLDFQNKSQQPVEVQSMSVVVRESMTENKPAIDISSPFVTGCASAFTPSMTLYNYGWGKAKDGKFQVGFVAGGSKTRPDRLPYQFPIGDLDQRKEINYEKTLAEAGVNLRQLKSYSGETSTPGVSKTLPCNGMDNAACLKALQGNAMFGRLGPLLRVLDNTVYVEMKGDYSYTWTDAKGKDQSHTSPISLPVGLGVLPHQAECGAGGPPEAIRTRPIKLRLDAENYTIPVPFRRAIPPGRTANFTLPLMADKSSNHQFEIVAKLADGREIKSPPIKLLYYNPRPMPTN